MRVGRYSGVGDRHTVTAGRVHWCCGRASAHWLRGVVQHQNTAPASRMPDNYAVPRC